MTTPRICKRCEHITRQEIDDVPCQRETFRTNLFEEEGNAMNIIHIKIIKI